MILFTDIGKDVDDAVALTYAIISKIPIQAIICTSKQCTESALICHNIIEHLSDKYPMAKKIKIYTGSTKPIKANGHIKKELQFHDNIYKGAFSKGNVTFKEFDPLKLKKQDAVGIGPLTDVLRAMPKIKRILFMGQAKKEGWLVPDMEAYNFRCDSYAAQAVFQYQSDVPMAFVGKTLAYRVPMKREDFFALQDTGHPVGAFLKEHAFASHQFMMKNLPKSIFGNPDIVAYCYDPLCMLAVTNPELFTFEVYKNARIAVNLDWEKAKDILMKKLLEGLSS